MNHSRRDTTTAPDDPTRVTVDDLERIGALQSLLSTLNDPRAGADVLARHIAAMPVLKARVESRFKQHHPNFKKHGLAQQIALLGNRVLEGILLELLEDLVMLHSDVEPSKRYTF
ncbi:MAG TPA: hypothetical protein VN894_08125 [Polyangiaceae bacterium]|nr:hypothetical protein [Polyangiaceae bacterium]